MTKYNTVAEAYGFWKNSSVAVMEARAKAIEKDIAEDPNADVAGYAIEAEALEQAIAEKRGAQPATSANAPAEVANTAKGEKDGEGAASKVYRSAFFKHLQGNKLTQAEQAAFDNVNAEARANAFNKLSDTAAVIPTHTLNEIIVKARDMGGIMSISRGFHMPANISIPVATPGAAASWHVEGAAVETEKVSPVPVTFGAYEIMRILSISAAVRTMSIGAFESYLADELTASVMACLGNAMVDGTGSGQGTGIVSGITWTDGTNKVTVAANKSLAYADIVNAIALLHRGYSQNARFVMNNTTLYTDVYGLVDENKRPIFVADPVEKGKGRILGFPVVIDDYMEDHDILFGDFRYNGWNMPEGIALDVSRDSSFTKGLIDYRALAIADCKPIVADAFVYVTKATA
ncbi:Predicted phage phi-C31 gp36 major capsid-like protein [Slackia heliotrinireducens]|uniref:Phage major capsid protein, HK97 family n=1 Tax=Slackia heliotrinireducens (strain ATCC 29202 / DSM 20476 / NCTC 11029 / RHS 1) TaxID=471855 RepID=C7N4P4_SLAHD|nr:phage major capsid protein [Slackia heliotrinireducens]ACV21879.1 phage major capsid protein, HK97 family [Slackia heliotrinireducens DSM 20476]VEG99655.1 Predicted phage phi-C31 gp36 major capsid-like protein [Slackia heliotrinireducens]